ncbi:N-acetyltransferase family protein [Prolixibacteraceae bacterium JC049]|nr:N-acetyltransferase family protein [Prolixibacteraceae bacterium JC049]
MKFREATLSDLATIVSIYNEIIAEGGFTADLAPYSVEDKLEWFKATNNNELGVWIIEEHEKVIGYFYFSHWRNGRKALLHTKEVSVFIGKEYRNKGIGKEALRFAISIAQQRKLRVLLAILMDNNERSKKVLTTMGFTTVGILKNVAEVNGKIIDQCIMQFQLSTSE